MEEAPQLLPLAGSPRISILGREVRLGTGLADLIAVEHSGRPVVIEIKLARNAEARRAVIAQVLAYAAYLFGLTAHDFERDVLGKHLQQRGVESAFDAVEGDEQAGLIDRDDFEAALAANLSSGHFRLVLVLDDAPEELVRLVGYLEAVTPELIIDLIRVSQYQVGGSQLLVPQRVDPERVGSDDRAPVRASKNEGTSTPGLADYWERLEREPEGSRPLLRRVGEWVEGLETEGVTATCYDGSKLFVVLPRLPVEDVGLVSVCLDSSGPFIQFWRSVIERRSPGMLAALEAAAAPARIGQGTTTRAITDDLLSLLTRAYREALESISS